MKSPTTKLPPLTSQHPPALAPSSGTAGGDEPTVAARVRNRIRPAQTETARIEPPPASEPTGPPPRPVTAETLADALPPKAAQANVDLPAATVGSAYRAELPTFVDPGGKGLRLTASGLPDGLTFSDLGGGKGAIEGVPQQAASASIRIVATNHHDRTAQMSATLVVGDKPAPPPAPVAKLEPPTPPPRRSHLTSRFLRNCGAAAVDGCASLRASAVSTDNSGGDAGSGRTKRGAGGSASRPRAADGRARGDAAASTDLSCAERESSSACRARFGGGQGQGVHRELRRGRMLPHRAASWSNQTARVPGRRSGDRAVPPLRFSLQARGRRRGRPDSGADHRRAVSRPRSRPPRRARWATAASADFEEL